MTTKTEENLSTREIEENYVSTKNNFAFKAKNKPDLIKYCLLCNNQIKIKYIYPKKRYSLKNNWGYWTQKEENNQKYLCNTCLVKLYQGNINDWILSETKADIFYNYVKRGQF